MSCGAGAKHLWQPLLSGKRCFAPAQHDMLGYLFHSITKEHIMLTAALEGVRVLDMTQIMAGPFCAMLLADLGAEVIKIENPRGGDDSRRMAPPYYNGESAAFIAMNRNKYGIAIDIRTPAGKEMLWRLIATADVLVENFRPGTMERLGFGFEAVHARHPALVYCSISGFGHTGP